MGFRNLEEYQAANVQVGQKVLLKGIDISESKPGILVKAIHADDTINLDTNDLEVVEIDEFRDQIISNFKITKQLGTENMAVKSTPFSGNMFIPQEITNFKHKVIYRPKLIKYGNIIILPYYH